MTRSATASPSPMSRGAMLAAWVAAGALALWACLALLRVPEPVERPVLPEGVATVIIGSSLTGRALPFSPPEDPAPGAGHVSWIVNGISASATHELAETAIEQGAKRVFVEFNAFVGVRDIGPPGLSGEVIAPLRRLTRQLNRGLTALSGSPPERLWTQAKRPIRDRGWLEDRRIDRRAVERTGPQGAERLRALLARAERAGVSLVFFEPPRSESIVAWFEGTPVGDWYGYAGSVAEAHGIDLVTFGAAYPDSHFADPTHLNELGRARFTRAFADRFGVPR